MEYITFVLTSCGRVDLLEKTVDSFLEWNDYPIYRYIIIDDSADNDVFEDIKKLNEIKWKNKFELFFNEEKIGQTKSIDKIYNTINTKYIFHCEDDWLFYNKGFIKDSIDILDTDDNIFQVWIRPKSDGIFNKIDPQHVRSNNGAIYRKVLPASYAINQINGERIIVRDYIGVSFNPGLRRKRDYNIIESYHSFGHEHLIDAYYRDNGYYVV
jgi:hypothetical protein